MSKELTKEQEMELTRKIIKAKLSSMTGHTNIMLSNDLTSFHHNINICKGKLKFIMEKDEIFRKEVLDIINKEVN